MQGAMPLAGAWGGAPAAKTFGKAGKKAAFIIKRQTPALPHAGERSDSAKRQGRLS